MGWERLHNDYYVVPDGPQLEFRYGDKSVSGGGAPKQVWRLVDHIKKLTKSMSLVAKEW